MGTDAQIVSQISCESEEQAISKPPMRLNVSTRVTIYIPMQHSQPPSDTPPQQPHSYLDLRPAPIIISPRSLQTHSFCRHPRFAHPAQSSLSHSLLYPQCRTNTTKKQKPPPKPPPQVERNQVEYNEPQRDKKGHSYGGEGDDVFEAAEELRYAGARSFC